ncbi:MAG: tRNA (adenosine(37)-N6)-threonylcarbamoyltransferase complex dimerization subunit type 1 TsaB [Dehalococcoidia bacterium]|nr:tRNA (adenosine(37)-N6)-threonylcarbamoyltransferase complex dimerization subunit type 1 TsaB [Dehalococcoidia bacterium]
MQLAIDTSTHNVSTALSSNGEISAKYKWDTRMNHTVELLPNILRLIEQSASSINSIDGLAVAIGPGNFNGLRVGISVAKGLSLSLNIPIVGIGTLTAEAFAHSNSPLPICPIISASRHEIAAALYQIQEGKWLQLTKEHITTVTKLLSETPEDTIFCGEITPSVETELKNAFGEKASISHLTDQMCRANLIAQLGWRRLSKGDLDNPTSLQPLYLRRPPITKPKASKHVLTSQNIPKRD